MNTLVSPLREASVFQCPAWCDGGHTWDETHDGRLATAHSMTLADMTGVEGPRGGEVLLSLESEVALTPGPAESVEFSRSPIRVWLLVDGPASLTPEQARELSQRLTEAAERAEAVASSTVS